MANKSNTTVVPPSIPSGFARRKRAIIGGLAFLTLVYFLVYYGFKDGSTGLRPAERFCKEQSGDEPCSRSDLFGFQVSSGIMQIFMSTTGFLAWHIKPRRRRRAASSSSAAASTTPEGRLFGYIEDADKLNAGIFIFQTWDFFASLAIPEHATTIFLTHHVLSALTAWFSLEYQMVHHYAIFFGGCSEISTIFLVFCDFDVFFPASRGSWWAGFILFCQVFFTLSFIYYRVIGWWIVSYQLWSDVLYAHRRNIVEQYRPGKGWFLYIFLAMDVMLGLLQLYWFGFGIVPKILEIASAGSFDAVDTSSRDI